MSARQGEGEVPDDQVIVLFGATGDLAKRKLLPGMFHLTQVGLMPESFRIIGAARHALDLEEFRAVARDAVCDSGRRSEEDGALDQFLESLRFAGVGEGLDELGR